MPEQPPLGLYYSERLLWDKEHPELGEVQEVLRRLALYRGAWKELREVLAKANLGTTVGDDVL